MAWTITAKVRGTVRFPEHPTHCGQLGLEGGEDVLAERDTFRSIGEAMTWARKVLDGHLTPQWTAFGDLVAPVTDPGWETASVHIAPIRPTDDDDECQTFETYHGTRDWTRAGEDTPARTDPEAVAA